MYSLLMKNRRRKGPAGVTWALYFYSFLGLDTPDICIDFVWEQRFGPIKLDLSSKLTDENKPVLVVDFDNRPTKQDEY